MCAVCDAWAFNSCKIITRDQRAIGKCDNVFCIECRLWKFNLPKNDKHKNKERARDEIYKQRLTFNIFQYYYICVIRFIISFFIFISKRLLCNSQFTYNLHECKWCVNLFSYWMEQRRKNKKKTTYTHSPEQVTKLFHLIQLTWWFAHGAFMASVLKSNAWIQNVDSDIFMFQCITRIYFDTALIYLRICLAATDSQFILMFKR